MAGPLSSPQGLRIDTDSTLYDDGNKRLRRRTRILAVDGTGTPIWSIIARVLTVGLKIGINLQSNHDLEKQAGKALLHWAVINDGDPFPSSLQPIIEDTAMSHDLQTNVFDTDGKWFGFNLPAVARPPAKPVLCFEMNVRNFKVKGKWSIYPSHIVAVEAISNFNDHFVLGVSAFTSGKNNQAVDFSSTVIAFP